ncbi:MAG: hypothetical protein GX331_05185, partial [Firmicutes bacterium]|nr:hypothetical protein [Bacillota bacterium]
GGISVYPIDPSNGSGNIAEDVTTQKIANFHMSADLDITRINRDVQKLIEEVISHLINAEGSRVQVSLEVAATSSEGFSAETVRTVSENSKTLKVDKFEFDG